MHNTSTQTDGWDDIPFCDDPECEIHSEDIMDFNTKRKLKKVAIGAGIVGAGAVAGVGAVLAAPVIIGAAGFGAAGVAAGSAAAAVQSWIGSVAAGSLFASLQSAGVLGLAATTNAAVGATVAAGTSGTVLLATRRNVSAKNQTTQTRGHCPNILKKIQDYEADTTNLVITRVNFGRNVNIGQNSDSLTATKKNSSSISQSNSKEALPPEVYNNTKLPTKKKMWFDVFQPSYKSKSLDFKKYFKGLPAEERLIVDYSCALQRDILVQGRMYVSQSYISFYANIFGWETQICIRLKDVTSITKEKTALVIPNAVQVCTEAETFFFASFLGRDATFTMLSKLWQTALLQDRMPMEQVRQLVHSCYGDVESDDEDED